MSSLYCKQSSIDLKEQYLCEGEPTSISLWFNMQDKITNNENTIISQNSNRCGAGRFSCGITEGKCYVYYSNVGTLYSKTPIVNDKWYNVTLVYDGKSNMICYLNGTPEIELNIDGFQNSNTYLLSYACGESDFVNAYIAEFKIYKHSLSENDVRRAMFNTIGNEILYFNFGGNSSEILNVINNEKYKINNFNSISSIMPPIRKYIISENNKYYSIKDNNIVAFNDINDALWMYNLPDINKYVNTFNNYMVIKER